MLRNAHQTSRTLSRHFAFRINTRSIIAPTRGYIPIYSRDELKRRADYPNYEADRLKEAQDAAHARSEKYHFDMKSNDLNPANFIKQIKIRSSQLADASTNATTESLANAPELTPSVAPTNPDILIYRRDPPNPIISARLGRNKGSVKKIAPVMRLIRGLHINDAIEKIRRNHRRVGKRIYTALRMVRSHALNRGFSDLRLYVKDAITNRQRRIKGQRYHAKMRRGLEKMDWCTLLIRLEEKPAREFFKDFVGGKAPLCVVKMWKAKIMQNPNRYDLIRKYQFLLTAKGRQQRREMVKRKAYKLQQELSVT